MKLKDLYRELIKNKKVNENDIRDLLIFHQKYQNYNAFFTRLNDDVKNEKAIRKDFNKLLKGYPLAYLINTYPFLEDHYFINKDVLIPRPETEELVMLLYRRLIQYGFTKKKLKLLDVGTGSGVIASQIAKHFKSIDVSATDISLKALKVAKKNANKLNVKVKFFNVDTFPNNNDKYDVIISNPPYIKYKKDIDQSVIDYEPLNALLISKNNNVYEKILKSKRYNSPSLILFEIAPNLVEDLKKIMNKYLKSYSYVFSKDINHKIRFLSILIK